MQFLKTAFLILSATSAVSADFAPNIANFNARASVKNIFERNPFRNMFQNVQTAGRRLASGPMSAECKKACPKVGDLILEYAKEENVEKMKKGDESWKCPMMDIEKCVDGAKACQEGDDKADDGGMAKLECMCACPDSAKLKEMKPEDYCKAGNAMECMSTKSECSASFKKDVLKGRSKEDHDEGMKIHCAMIKEKCYEAEEKKGECAKEDLANWYGGEESCEQAAVDGKLADSADKDECCKVQTRMVKCYKAECVKLGMRNDILKAKDASTEEKKRIEKEMTKNYNIGKACPDSGMPKSAADLKPPPATAASDAWVALPHAIPFAVMLSALYA